MTSTSDHRFAGIFAAVFFELASVSSVAASAASSPRPPTPYVVKPGCLAALTTTDVTPFGLLEGVTLAAIGALVIGLVAVIAIEIERSNLGYRTDGRIFEALTHAFETNNFSEEWVQDAVAVRGDDILADARKIEQQEA